MMRKIKIKYLFILSCIFLPIFTSFGVNGFISFSRNQGEVGFFFTIPISAIFIFFFLLICFKKFKFNLTQISLLIIAIYVIAIGFIYGRNVFYLHGLGIGLFVVSNSYFKFFFSDIVKKNAEKIFQKNFIFFILIFFSCLIISLYIIRVNSPFPENALTKNLTFFLHPKFVIFNWVNYFPSSLLLILSFLIDYKKIYNLSSLLLFIIFVVTSYVIYFSTSSTSNLILIVWIIMLLFNNNIINKFIFSYYFSIFILVCSIIVISSFIIDPNGILSHNIRFRFSILQYYMKNLNFIEFFIPINSPVMFNFSAHNQTLSFFIYGGFVLVFLFYKNLKQLIDVIPNEMKHFKYSILIFLILGSQTQNYFTHPYLCILISFFIHYSTIIYRKT